MQEGSLDPEGIRPKDALTTFGLDYETVVRPLTDVQETHRTRTGHAQDTDPSAATRAALQFDHFQFLDTPFGVYHE